MCDDSAPDWDWIPDATVEPLIPGRTLLARRQGMEFDRLQVTLDNTGYPFLAEADLLALLAQATHKCHVLNTCPAFATVDEVNLVVHKWLDMVTPACTGQPPSPGYSGAKEIVTDAMALELEEVWDI